MKKLLKDKITGTASVAFGILMIVYIIPNWVVMSDQLNHTSPDTFPKFISYALIFLGASLLIQAFLSEHKERQMAEHEIRTIGKTAEHALSWREFMESDIYCILVTASAILLFDFLLKRVGYIITGFSCSLLLLAAFRSKKWYHYVIAVAFTFLLYFLFGKVLMVKMP